MSGTSISIITVCRNSRKYIPAVATSVLSALGESDEWVVQDGASTDGTVDFLRSLQDPRVRMESRPDGGIYDAMNRATERAVGDFRLFLGADDRMRVRLDEVRAFLKDERTVYYGDAWLTAACCRYDGIFDGAKLAHMNICHQSIFYPRAAFEQRSYDTRYVHQADWVFNMDCFADPSMKFEYIPLLIADFSQDGATSVGMDEAFQRDYRVMLKKYFSFRQRWRPALLSLLSDLYRALPGVPPPRQTPLRVR